MGNDHHPDPTSEPGATIAERLGLAAAVLSAAVIVGWVLWRCHAGFDFTDEGSYFVSIARPGDFVASNTQFGFVYYPLYRLVGGDIALFRQANVLITLGLAWSLGVIVLQTQLPELGPAWRKPRLATTGVAFALSTSALSHFDPWLITPSYNSLALQALLLAGAGFLLADEETSRVSLAGWILIGFSGWLAFLAKPTTALALAIVATVYLLLSWKLRPRLLLVAVSTTLIFALISAWAIDGSVGGFVNRLAMGAQDAGAQDSRYSMSEIWRWDDFSLGHGEKTALAVMTGLVFLASLLGSAPRRGARICSVAVACVFSGACIWIVTGQTFPQWSSTPFRGLAYWGVPFGAWLAALVCARRNLLRFVAPGRLALVLCLVSLPHACAFGSDGNYCQWASRYAIFWVLASIPFLALASPGKRSWCAFLPAAAGAQVITASLLFLSMEAPYRQPQPLRLDENVTHVGVLDSQLRTSREVADYFDKLARVARQGGFHTGDPLLDMTGNSPGTLFALGAKSVGQPWIIGGCPGSTALAVASLDRVPREELRRAWVLAAPTDPRRLSPDILTRYGLDLAKDFQDVGVVRTPKGEYAAGIEQHLFKPHKCQ